MKNNKFAFGINLTFVLSLLSSGVYAAGFQLLEQDASDLGRAYAGGAITGDNAVIEYDNPAAMTQLKAPAISAVAEVISAHANFTGTATNAQGHAITAGAENPFGTDFIPAFHYVQPINNKFTFGFGITTPFGLSSEYDGKGIARYFATKSKLITLNFNPSLAYAITDKFSLGFGVSAQYLHYNANQKFDPSFIFSEGSQYDAEIQNTVSDWGYGFNLGLAYDFSEASKLGFSYRSAVRHRPSGEMKVYYPAALTAEQIAILQAAGYRDTNVASNLDLPATYLLSYSQQFSSNWTGMATISYTDWSHYRVTTFHYSTEIGAVAVDEGYQDSWRFALGTDYRLNDRWMLRFGTAYDTSPENNGNRDVSVADSNRFWLALGANYKFNSMWSLDAAYAHVFLQNGTVTKRGTSVFENQTLNGKYDNGYANVMGLQLNWKLS